MSSTSLDHKTCFPVPAVLLNAKLPWNGTNKVSLLALAEFYQCCTQWGDHFSTSACIKTHDILLQPVNQAIKFFQVLHYSECLLHQYVHHPQPPETQKIIVRSIELGEKRHSLRAGLAHFTAPLTTLIKLSASYFVIHPASCLSIINCDLMEHLAQYLRQSHPFHPLLTLWSKLANVEFDNQLLNQFLFSAFSIITAALSQRTT